MKEYNRGRKAGDGEDLTKEEAEKWWEETYRKERAVKEEMVKADPRFSSKTYYFLERALDRAFFEGMGNMADVLNTPDGKPREKGHVAAPDFCYEVAKFAVEEYGRLAKTTLAKLGLRSTSDVGDAMYNMIRFGLVATSKYDERSDFDNVLDLGETIDKLYERERKYSRRDKKRWLP